MGTLSLKKVTKSDVGGTTVDNLAGMVGDRFIKNRFGIKTVVELVEVRNRKVVLHQEGRADSFTISKEEFLKYYNVIK